MVTNGEGRKPLLCRRTVRIPCSPLAASGVSNVHAAVICLRNNRVKSRERMGAQTKVSTKNQPTRPLQYSANTVQRPMDRRYPGIPLRREFFFFVFFSFLEEEDFEGNVVFISILLCVLREISYSVWNFRYSVGTVRVRKSWASTSSGEPKTDFPLGEMIMRCVRTKGARNLMSSGST